MMHKPLPGVSFHPLGTHLWFWSLLDRLRFGPRGQRAAGPVSVRLR